MTGPSRRAFKRLWGLKQRPKQEENDGPLGKLTSDCAMQNLLKSIEWWRRYVLWYPLPTDQWLRVGQLHVDSCSELCLKLKRSPIVIMTTWMMQWFLLMLPTIIGLQVVPRNRRPRMDDWGPPSDVLVAPVVGLVLAGQSTTSSNLRTGCSCIF